MDTYDLGRPQWTQIINWIPQRLLVLTHVSALHDSSSRYVPTWFRLKPCWLRTLTFTLVLSETGVGWIDSIANAVKSGHFHIALLACSLAWTGASVHYSQPVKNTASLSKASQISFRYELPSQFARSAALAFTIVAAVRGPSSQWYNVVPLSYAFFLGLTRLANNLRWRHIALHQVNFLIGTCLLILAAGELLPTLVIDSTYRPSGMTVGAIASLFAATIIALCTPREWTPPPINLDLIQRPAEAEPAPEEVCSWWTLYLSYEWLTPLVWRGMRHGPRGILSVRVSQKSRAYADCSDYPRLP